MAKKSLAKLLAEDIEAGTIRLRLDQAMQAVQPRTARKRALHVSDFTKSETEYCLRELAMRYWRGSHHGQTTWVQYDGVFRERKWYQLFEKAGILKGYQEEFKLGRLVGHPDFIVDLGHGERCLDLTGQDPRHDAIFRARHLAAKKRQVRLYNVMSGFAKGYILAEDKASCEFQVIPVPRDDKEERVLTDRVAAASRVAKEIDEVEPNPEYMAAMLATMEACKRTRCRWCGVNSPLHALEPPYGEGVVPAMADYVKTFLAQSGLSGDISEGPPGEDVDAPES